jgi:hypothetical protein
MKKLNTFKTLAAFAFLTLLYAGCKKDDSVLGSFNYSYFPMAVGDSLIYDVHLYDKDLNEVDSSYQLLECVESIFADNEGRPTFRLERYVRNTPADDWQIYKVWTANLNTTTAEKKEENITYIKLVFPVKKNLNWNGNIKNVYANDFDNYKITSINQPLSQNSLNFDSTLTVTQIDYDYGFEKRYYIEKYAAGVGMIYKEQNDSLQGPKVRRYTETLIYHNN